MFQDAPDHGTFGELEDMAQRPRFWRSLVVAIEPEDTYTLALQRRKKARKTRSLGTTTLDLDTSQWLIKRSKQTGEV